MQLREFMRAATPKEREQVAAATDISVPYLQKIASGGRCSISTAYEIEMETTRIASRNPNLTFVPGESLVKEPERYRAFVKKVNGSRTRTLVGARLTS
jgi:hypothetical protein